MKNLKIYFLLLFLSVFVVVNSQTSDSVLNEKNYFIQAHTMAANEFNDSLLKEYVKLYPKGYYSAKALNSIDICAWQNARFKNTKESYELYLKEFPKGKAVKLAKQNLDLLSDSTINNN